jgi:polyphosphate kinase
MATLYRVASDSHFTYALISAARNGKKVAVLVEAKARFDEENNLRWAERMQLAGVQIVFSEEAIKVHSKVALVIRNEANRKKRKYAFLGTGNFNERTADVYTDYALLTADAVMTNELDDVLRFTLRMKSKVKLKHLLVAQINLPEEFISLIDQEIENATKGKKAEITLKLNNLQDKKMIKKLYAAAEQGVYIRLIIRGICCLIPRKNIVVTRIVDRFLEHARIYLFHNDGHKKLFIGSADWMERNLYRRIEVVFPVFDELARKIILHNLSLQLRDNTKAVRLDESLRNVEVKQDTKPVRAQYDFYQYLRRNYSFQ